MKRKTERRIPGEASGNDPDPQGGAVEGEAVPVARVTASDEHSAAPQVQGRGQVEVQVQGEGEEQEGPGEGRQGHHQGQYQGEQGEEAGQHTGHLSADL